VIYLASSGRLSRAFLLEVTEELSSLDTVFCPILAWRWNGSEKGALLIQEVNHFSLERATSLVAVVGSEVAIGVWGEIAVSRMRIPVCLLETEVRTKNSVTSAGIPCFSSLEEVKRWLKGVTKEKK